MQTNRLRSWIPARAPTQRAPLFKEGLSSLGYALSDIERIVITHAHVDHYGLAGEIARLSGASVYSHSNNRPILEDHRALIESRLAFHLRRAEAILAALQDGPCTAYALSQLLFPDLSAVDYFLAISEVLAHLEWLEARGSVMALRQNGLMLWRREPQSAPRVTF